MVSVFNMLRPLHFVLLLAVFAFLAFANAMETKDFAPEAAKFDAPDAAPNDLEADASSYAGYGQPWGYGRYYKYPKYVYPNYPHGWNRGWGRGYGGHGGYWR